MTQYNLTHQKQSDDDMTALPMFKNPFITIVKNDRHQRVELHLRGYFESPQESTQQLTELYQLAESYPTALVYINSGGGRVDLLMELHNALKKFETVITVVNSDAASAGFMLWASGDVRVVCPHAELMIHRESSGSMGKTDQMIDRVEFMKRRFEKVFSMFCSDVLQDDEMTRARLTEVWFTGEDMIDRGAAISWDQFQRADTTPYNRIEVIERDGEAYVCQGNLLVPVNISQSESALYSIFDVLYDVPNKKNHLEGGHSELGDAIAEAMQQAEAEEAESDDDNLCGYSMETPLTEEIIRQVMREVFGKGKYRIYWPGTVVGIYQGREVEILSSPTATFFNLTVGDLAKGLDKAIEGE